MNIIPFTIVLYVFIEVNEQISTNIVEQNIESSLMLINKQEKLLMNILFFRRVYY